MKSAVHTRTRKTCRSKTNRSTAAAENPSGLTPTPQKPYQLLTEEFIRDQTRIILNTSTDRKEAEQRLRAELGYPHKTLIIHFPNRIAMLWGPNGQTISI